MDKQKIKIIAGTIVDGLDARPGTVLNVVLKTAKQLFAAGKAVPIEDKPEKPTVRKPMTKKKPKK